MRMRDLPFELFGSHRFSIVEEFQEDCDPGLFCSVLKPSQAPTSCQGRFPREAEAFGLSLVWVKANAPANTAFLRYGYKGRDGRGLKNNNKGESL